VVTVTDGTSPVLRITGEFEMHATFTIEPAMDRVLETPGLEMVTLDLSGVTFIDSVGLGVVIRLASELETRRVPLRILPGPPEVQRVFEVVGLADALPFDRVDAGT
jgi:stage II sporulation protein AA (anti-sigma F factor antagonist)